VDYINLAHHRDNYRILVSKITPQEDLCSTDLTSQETEQFTTFITGLSIYNSIKIKIIRQEIFTQTVYCSVNKITDYRMEEGCGISDRVRDFYY
jgi:hypothetical protein